MKRHGIFACLKHAMALFGQDMEEDRAILVLYVAQPTTQRWQVVAVNRTDIAEAELLKKHTTRQQSLEPVADLVDRLIGHAAEHGHLGQKIVQVAHRALVDVRQTGPIKATRQASGARAN